MTERSNDQFTALRSKRELNKDFRDKLSAVISGYEPLIGEKKFQSIIKKAAKQLSADVHKSMPKEKLKVKKEKKTKKSAAAAE